MLSYINYLCFINEVRWGGVDKVGGDWGGEKQREIEREIRKSAICVEVCILDKSSEQEQRARSKGQESKGQESKGWVVN